MKTKILSLVMLMLLPLSAHAGDADYAEGWKHISNNAFHSRLRIKGEIYLLDSTGKKLLAPTSETHEWQAGINSDRIETTWSVGAKGVSDIALHQVWVIKDDNSIDVTIQQYDHAERDMTTPGKYTYGKLIREDKMIVENFAPIVWVVETTKDHRTVARLTPQIDASKDVEDLQKIPIGGNRGTFTVSDNQGFMWADSVRFGGTIAALTCYRGSFVISYYPFKGATPIGTASGKDIWIAATDKLQIKIHSENDLVPDQMHAKVYGKFIPNFKTPSYSTYVSYGQDTLDYLPKEMK